MHVYYQLNVFEITLSFEKSSEIAQKLTDIEIRKILNVFDHLEYELKTEIKILEEWENLWTVFLNSLLYNDAGSLNAVEWGFDVMDNRSQLQEVLFFLIPEL